MYYLDNECEDKNYNCLHIPYNFTKFKKINNFCFRYVYIKKNTTDQHDKF